MRLAEVFAMVAGTATDVEFVAYDGSRAGTPGGSTRLELKSPRGVSLLLSSPGQLGVARAYVAGELEVEGDMYTALARLADLGIGHLTARDKVRLARALAPYAKGYRKVAPPPEEVRLNGGRHSKRRDAGAIHHHYDVSNRFYEWVLGPSMAYTCAVYPDAQATLELAQEEKFDLVCRKLDLKPGQRLLDVGCGWGGMVLHAVKNYGVTAIGVTLSQQQARHAQHQISAAGLTDSAQVRFQDYRDVPESGFDAVSSIGLTEHIGQANYPAYFDYIRGKLHPEGRLLNHCITRTDTNSKSIYRNGFINRYVFPDGELHDVGRIVSLMQRKGFEVRHVETLREHYALTLRAWVDNLEGDWEAAVAEVGEPRARVWRLYMAGSAINFEAGRTQVHQVLATPSTDDGRSGMPLRPLFE
jgi:cyclopropane-fatty-acyl-phospholipid synthase